MAMLKLGEEEAASYLYSLENLAALKIFHDAGVDVSGFSDFMMDVNYSTDAQFDILMDGCKELFSSFEIHSTYNEKDKNKEISDLLAEMDLPEEAEFYFLCSNKELNALVLDPVYKKKIEDKVDLINKEIYVGSAYASPYGGILIAFHFLAELNETVRFIVDFYNETQSLYQEMIKGECE